MGDLLEVELDPDELVQMIGTATYRNAFDFGLDHDVSRLNMVAYSEEFFDMNNSNDVWECTHGTIKQIKRMRKALST